MKLPAKPPVARAEAMVLAAGRGERMRPLTDHCPKPLLPVRGRPLMLWTLEALARGGTRRLLINTGWLGEQIPAYFGQNPASNGASVLLNLELLTLDFSHEVQDFGYALETAGGIVRALPRLADVFWVAAGDVYAPDFAFSHDTLARFAASGRLAHLWLVPNPPHHLRGDFGLAPDGRALNEAGAEGRTYTFSTIALYRRALFEPPWCAIAPGNPQGTAVPLAPLLRRAIDAGEVSAELFHGTWVDVGTPQRLALLDSE